VAALKQNVLAEDFLLHRKLCSSQSCG